MSLLLSPHEIKGLKLKNRVVMSPMCMHMAADDGFVTDWHRVHYGARALGQAGLIFPETLAVHADGRIGAGDLGIWSDAHIVGLKALTELLTALVQKPVLRSAMRGATLTCPISFTSRHRLSRSRKPAPCLAHSRLTKSRDW